MVQISTCILIVITVLWLVSMCFVRSNGAEFGCITTLAAMVATLATLLAHSWGWL